MKNMCIGLTFVVCLFTQIKSSPLGQLKSTQFKLCRMAMYTVNKPEGSKYRDDNLCNLLATFKYSINKVQMAW